MGPTRPIRMAYRIQQMVPYKTSKRPWNASLEDRVIDVDYPGEEYTTLEFLSPLSELRRECGCVYVVPALCHRDKRPHAPR